MQLLPKDVQYEMYKIESPEQLEQAVKNDVYPPCLTCKVTSSQEAKESGKHKDVKFVLEGTERPTDHMGFTCPAYEEKAKGKVCTCVVAKCMALCILSAVNRWLLKIFMYSSFTIFESFICLFTERDAPIGMNSTPHQEPSTPIHMTG